MPEPLGLPGQTPDPIEEAAYIVPGTINQAEAMIRRAGLKKGQKLRSREEIRRLAAEAYLLEIKGFSISEIGKALQLPPSTAYFYLKEMKRLKCRSAEQLAAQYIAQELFRKSDDRVQCLWRLYTTTQNDMVRLGCLTALRSEADHVIQHGQKLGVIHQEPQHQEIDVTHRFKNQEEMIDFVRGRLFGPENAGRQLSLAGQPSDQSGV